ncbi:MAG: DUF4249 family protein [Saprospiraceae bacterium]
MAPTQNYSRYWLLLCLLIFSACEEVTEWELTPGDNGQLVVEAILTDERKFQEIRLSRSYDELNGNAPPITNAVVSVRVANQSVDFLPDPADPGHYISEREFMVIRDLDFHLEIEWEGQSYSAVSRLSNVVPIPAISFIADPDTNLLSLAEFAPLYNPNQQAMYEVDIDWSQPNNDSLTQAKLFLYTFSTIDVSELVRPEREAVYFPPGSIVRVRKYGLNDDYADYLRALVLETQWRGGPFYSDATSLPTNISNGGLGFFSTCAVLEREVIAR